MQCSNDACIHGGAVHAVHVGDWAAGGKTEGKDARGNADINDNNILYLNEDKKRTRNWFQVCDISVPLNGTKFGFIRSIAYVDPKSQEENLQGILRSDRNNAPTFYSYMAKVVDGVKQASFYCCT